VKAEPGIGAGEDVSVDRSGLDTGNLDRRFS
jgi:hypothetical protein